MAKKKLVKKGSKAAGKKTKGKKAAVAVEPVPTIVVLYELSGVAGVRFHGEYSDIERARLAARSLVLSSDVSQAWITQAFEIMRKPSS